MQKWLISVVFVAMEILFLHKALSEHYIRDEANDKGTQGQLENWGMHYLFCLYRYIDFKQINTNISGWYQNICDNLIPVIASDYMQIGSGQLKLCLLLFLQQD